jgi:hypothetical protein
VVLFDSRLIEVVGCGEHDKRTSNSLESREHIICCSQLSASQEGLFKWSLVHIHIVILKLISLSFLTL